jgi:hypothetical protein
MVYITQLLSLWTLFIVRNSKYLYENVYGTLALSIFKWGEGDTVLVSLGKANLQIITF